MENSAKARRAPVLIEKHEAIRPSFAAVNDDGTAGAARDLELLSKDTLLNVARRMVVVIIEADFTQGEKFRMLRQLRELVIVRGRGELGFMWVNPGSGVDPVIALSEWH